MPNACEIPLSLSELDLPAADLARLAAYVPTSLDTEVWETCREDVWRVVVNAKPTGRVHAIRLAGALTTLLGVAEFTGGDIETLLTKDRVAATGSHLKRTGLSDGSWNNTRGRLNRLQKNVKSPTLLDPPTPSREALPPYTHEEVDRLLAAVRHVLAPDRYADVLTYGLGAGAAIPEVYMAVPTADGLDVDGTPVAWTGHWAGLGSAGLHEVTADDWAAAKTFVDSQPTLPSLCHRRLRRTWLVGLLSQPETFTAVVADHELRRRELDSAAPHLPVPTAEDNAALRNADVAARCGTSPGSDDPKEDQMARRRPNTRSAAAARRAREELLTSAPVPLPTELEEQLQTYQPRPLAVRAHWPTIRPVVVQIMRAATHVTGAGSFTDHLTTVTKLAAWAADQDLPVTLPDLMRYELIERYIAAGMAGKTDSSINTRRWRLKSLAHHVNPGPDAPPPDTPIPKSSVKAPYSSAERAAIVRIATTQPNPRIGRQLCLCVGLGLGAGLDARDFNDLRRRDIVEDADGLTVHVRGDRERVVPVRRDMEDLVRFGIDGVPPARLLVGTTKERRKATYKVYEQAVALGDPPPMVQSRMRTTWLADLLVNPVPLHVILTAAGLASTRSLTEIAAMIDAPGDTEMLRGSDQ